MRILLKPVFIVAFQGTRQNDAVVFLIVLAYGSYTSKI